MTTTDKSPTTQSVPATAPDAVETLIELVRQLKAEGLGSDQSVDGSDLVDRMNELLEELETTTLPLLGVQRAVYYCPRRNAYWAPLGISGWSDDLDDARIIYTRSELPSQPGDLKADRKAWLISQEKASQGELPTVAANGGERAPRRLSVIMNAWATDPDEQGPEWVCVDVTREVLDRWKRIHAALPTVLGAHLPQSKVSFPVGRMNWGPHSPTPAQLIGDATVSISDRGDVVFIAPIHNECYEAMSRELSLSELDVAFESHATQDGAVVELRDREDGPATLVLLGEAERAQYGEDANGVGDQQARERE